MDYYNERKFICELSGHSCLTYFEAVDSENLEAEQIISNFPEPLKEPILRKVQFSQISRLDTLVDDLYNSLRQDFFPGEIVIAKSNDQRIKVVIREKAKFNAITLPSGEIQPGYSRYRVELVSDPSQEMAVDDTQLTRDRKLFTKVILRTFIKHAVSRETWTGAPWLVKPEYANKYRIDSVIPASIVKLNPHLQQIEEKNKKLEAKMRAKEEKAREMAEIRAKTIEQKALRKAHQLREQQIKAEHKLFRHQHKGSLTDINNDQYDDSYHHHHHHHYHYEDYTLENELSSREGSLMDDKGYGNRDRNIMLNSGSSFISIVPKPVPMKPVIQEDLLFPFNPSVAKMPFKKETVLPDDKQQLVGSLLETWLFLNVYHEPLLLDPFTFDDFVDVLRLTDEESEVTLLNEIHCALLSAIVDDNTAELTFSLPFYEKPRDRSSRSHQSTEDAEDDEQEDEDNDENKIKKEDKGISSSDKKKNIKHENDSDPEDKMNVDEGKVDKTDDDGDVDIKTNPNDAADDEENEEDKPHKAASFIRYQSVDWKERLRKRMFKDGGWQQILICVLHTVSYVPEWADSISEALSHMASRDRSITLYSARTGYYELSFELRIKVLEILCHLLYGSVCIRSYIERCLEQSTRLRKERMDRQRETKVLQETLRTLYSEKNAYISEAGLNSSGESENTQDQQQPSQQQLTNGDAKHAEATLAKENPEFNKIYKEYESILAKIQEYADLNKKCEEELIRLDCQRIRLLGKDRFYNRYWWFESNGMRRPERIDGKSTVAKDEIGEEEKVNEKEKDKEKEKEKETEKEKGKATSKSKEREKDKDIDKEPVSKSSEQESGEEEPVGYAMGRLWIQGPTEEDSRVYLSKDETKLPPIIKTDTISDMETDNGNSRYPPWSSHHVNEPHEPNRWEQKKICEEVLFLKSYDDWGYYDQPEEIESLISWLNPYGRRETKLFKELNHIKPWLLGSINARREDLKADEQSRLEEIRETLDEEFAPISDDEEEEAPEKPAEENGDISLNDQDGDEEATVVDHDEVENGVGPGGRRRLRSRAYDVSASEPLAASALASRKRGPGRPPKRVALDREVIARERQKRNEKKRALREEKEQRRKELIEEMESRVPNRVLNWTNSLVEQELGHSHYEGAQKKRGPKKSSNGRGR